MEAKRATKLRRSTDGNVGRSHGLAGEGAQRTQTCTYPARALVIVRVDLSPEAWRPADASENERLSCE